MKKEKYACPCCGKFTLPARGENEICPVCFWMDGRRASMDEDVISKCNGVSLKTARRNYLEYGGSTPEMAFFTGYLDEEPDTAA